MKRLLSLLLISSGSLHAQKLNLDSLWRTWNDLTLPDTTRLKAIHKYAWNGYLFMKPDSAYYFAQLEYDLAKEKGLKKHITNALNTQGVSLAIRGDYSNAINHYTRCFEINEELDDKVGMAANLNNIGHVYYEQGDLSKALDYYTRSLNTEKEQTYKNGVGATLNNIGSIYSGQGDNTMAIEYFTRGLKIYEEYGDKMGVANSFGNIGVVYGIQGDYVKAIEYYTKCLKIHQEIGNKLGAASSLCNIALLYMEQGEYTVALDYYDQCLKIYEEINDQKGKATSLNGFGLVYKYLGDFSKALEFNERSLSIAQQIGADYLTKKSCSALIKINTLLDSSEKASVAANLLRDLRLKDLQINFSTLSEQQKEKYFATMQSDFDLLYDFSFRYPDLTHQSENAYNNSLITKGLLLKSTSAMRNAIINSGDSILAEQYDNWLALKRRIAKAYAAGVDISRMEEQANELEKELVKNSQEFSDFKKVQSLTWKEVQSGLKEGESAIEFIRFSLQKDLQFSKDNIQLYAALIIDNKCEYPKMVRLFEETELEKIIGTFPGNNLSYIDHVYGSKTNTNSQLYDLIWKPLEKEIAGSKKVFVSPDGLLHKISFAALAKEQDVYLCDLYDLELMSSTGKIAVPLNVSSNEKTTITIFGGINYNGDSTNAEIWNFLEGTMSEAQQIEKILKKENVSYNFFYQSNATEGQFKKSASESNILHVATHGFFYSSPDLANEESTAKEETGALNFRGGKKGMGVSTFIESNNPLMRSGLAFAGANDVWNKSAIEGEDGVLTAAEVATIDMRNTELVVLSACETGLGDIKGSEGVYGLQRAFKMAGVKYIIMSLWQVPDKETAEFMTTFYKNLTKTNDIRKSFNLTQQTMRKKYDPYYWGAFVLIE